MSENHFSLTADDLLFIYYSSYDDIHVISDLINRQGQIDQWNYENPPVAEKLMHQHLFDTPEEAKLASSLFMKSYLDSEITKSISENESIIYSKWFDESRIIGQYHKDVVWPGFSEYRKMTGLPND
ncbi:MAG: hypothetical protein NW226_22240 [Microscillaceae bacterium]|nr:hypothetical protein [Microscillaceae bacterium]